MTMMSCPRRVPSPLDEEVDDARWLAGLVLALRTQLASAGHPEVSAILDEVYNTAQAAASEAEPKDEPS